MDEAKKSGITINIDLLEKLLDIKVIDTCGHDRNSLIKLKDFIYNYTGKEKDNLQKELDRVK